MAFKANGRRNSENSMLYKPLVWNVYGVEENNTEALSTKWNKDFSGYKSRILTNQYFYLFRATKAKVALYNNSMPLGKYFTFKTEAADRWSWFVRQAVDDSSWTDYKSATTVHTLGREGIYFIDQNNYFKCQENAGWIRVLDHGKDRCANFPIQKRAGIFFSKKDTAAFWGKAEDVGEADVLIIFLQ